jgi:flagellar motor switch protein FliN/FliY
MTVFEQIRHLADIPVDLSVELGRKLMTVSEILELAPGAVIKLPRSAGENIDVLAGETTLGSAEIVVIEENLGVRITDFVEDN